MWKLRYFAILKEVSQLWDQFIHLKQDIYPISSIVLYIYQCSKSYEPLYQNKLI